ncbi:hypothetical protein CVS40_8212 [Lucilia cuprina]|nr:hypothetical protein CVS40_8212 [Lucilia cuprina]
MKYFRCHWFSTPERTDSQSAKDCELSNSCINLKFFAQGKTSSDSQQHLELLENKWSSSSHYNYKVSYSTRRV